MIKGELAGKLGRISGSEDALVSNVFGVLDYMNDLGCLRAILKATRTMGGAVFPDEALDRAASFRIHFWPRFVDGSQPDVVIVFLTLSGEAVALVVVECKYRSGLSWWESADGSSEALSSRDRENQLTLYGEDLLQSAFSASELRKQAREAGNRRYLLYVTTDYTVPHDDLDHATQQLERAGLQTFWTSWRDVSLCLSRYLEGFPEDRGKRDMVGDLVQLLVARKGLTRFRGMAPGLRVGRPLTSVRLLSSLAREAASPYFSLLRLGREPSFGNIPLGHVKGEVYGTV